MSLSNEEKVRIDYYNRNAEYRAFSRSNKNSCKDEFQKFKKLLPAGKVLDVGCGNGRDTGLFLENGFEYVGIDPSEKLIEQAKKGNPKAQYSLMSAYAIDFPDNHFDGFWSFAVFMHIPREKAIKALRELNRVVRSGGVGYISLKRYEEGFEGMKESELGKRYFVSYGRNEFKGLLEEVSFEIIDIEERVKENHETGTAEYLMYYVRNIKLVT